MPLINASPLAIPPGGDVSAAWQESVPVAQPAAGQVFVRTTDGVAYEQLLTAHFLLNTDAAAGNRIVNFVVQDPNGGNVFVGNPPSTQAPSLQLNYSIDGNGQLQYALPAGGAVMGMPPLLLLPGYKFFITIGNMDAGDQILAVSMIMLRIPNYQEATANVVVAPTPLLV